MPPSDSQNSAASHIRISLPESSNSAGSSGRSPIPKRLQRCCYGYLWSEIWRRRCGSGDRSLTGGEINIITLFVWSNHSEDKPMVEAAYLQL
ncbi:hypothetical protein BRADI_2g16862v3 [Brachypodium distachyon]|uniref:Uncharacterized protein n=1 Tax=Brachypodium distachyon TaxID=15368 RepID=A0A2K2D8W2_BRADI|nr:hypothetical protein BRADI_2g16862v3 [Brachypodium distachyon]